MNIAEILKYCPKGTKLYSTAFGEVELIDTSSLTNTILVQNIHDKPFTFYSNGSYVLDGECILFPSKDQRNWSKFRLPIKRGDIMMDIDDKCAFITNGKFDEHNWPIHICAVNCYDNLIINDKEESFGWTKNYYIPASEEAREKLFDKMAEVGYKWNTDILKLEKVEPIFKEGDIVVCRNGSIILVSKVKSYKIVSNAILYTNSDFAIYNDAIAITYFTSDIRLASVEERNKFYSALVKAGYKYDKEQHKLVKQEFKPFDKVLVRDKDTNPWKADIYLDYEEENRYYHYKCARMNHAFCIPYEGNEYLLDTKISL